MMHFFFSQRGSTSILAILAMVVLLSLGSTFLYMTLRNETSTKSLADGMNAEYLAQAGYQFAFISVREKQQWPSNKPIYVDLSHPELGTFTLKITKGASLVTAEATITSADAGIYTIESTGTMNGVKRVFVGTIEIKAGTGGSTGSTVVWIPPTTDGYKNTIKYAALADGDLTAWSDTGAKNLKYGTDYRIGTTKKIKSSQVQIPAVESVQGVELKLLDATFFKPSTYGALQLNKVPSNFWDASLFQPGKYHVTGDLSFNMVTPLTTTGADQAFYYVDGNVNISAPLNGNFVIIAEGNIQLNSACTGNIQLYAKKDIKIYNSVTGYGVFMALQNLTVTQGTYNKAFLFGDNSVKLSGAKVTGAVYSRGTLTMEGGAYVEYDNSAIPQ